MEKKKFRNGNGVLEIAKQATGRAAETLRQTIEWNTYRERDAKAKRRHKDAARYAVNRASCIMKLIELSGGKK